MEDQLRVTVVATGLGVVAGKVRKPEMKIVETVGLRTGTDNLHTYDIGAGQVDLSGVISSNRSMPRNTQAEAMAASGVDKYDIPAFLRRQSD